MDQALSPRTTRDALLLELLGDVGRLHQQINALGEAVPSLTAQIDGRLHEINSVLATVRALQAELQAQHAAGVTQLARQEHQRWMAITALATAAGFLLGRFLSLG